jgi:hypothetical protein
MISNRFYAGFNRIISQAGKQIQIINFTTSIGTGSVYDDDVVMTGSTINWTSGVIFSLDPNGSEDRILLEQGKIDLSSKRLYISGGISLTGSEIVKIGLGSPSTEYYQLISLGADAEEVSNNPIYKKAYITKVHGDLYG